MSNGQEGEPCEAPRVATSAPEPADCWRCGKSFDAVAPVCPYCRARSDLHVTLDRPRVSRETGGSPPPTDPAAPVVRLIGFYAAMLATSIVFAMISRARFPIGGDPDEADRVWQLHAILTFEAIDTAIVLAAWCALRRTARPADPRSPVLAWMAAGPVLALLLMLNYGYHWLLLQLVASPPERNLMLQGREWLYLIAHALQPAIVEEVFFRGLAIEWFRAVTTTRAALVVSSVMFGLCHIYVPASVPYLIVAGFVFGAARLCSGGLLLPMVLHFFHNFLIILWEHHRA